MARPPRRTQTPATTSAPFPDQSQIKQEQPTIGDIVEGLRTKSLTLEGEALAAYDNGHSDGAADAEVDNASYVDPAEQTEPNDNVYYRAGYKLGFDETRTANAQRAANLGAAGDHDKNGKVGGAAPAQQPDEKQQAQDDADYQQGRTDGLLYTGAQNDEAAGIKGKSDAYQRGFRDGATSSENKRNSLPTVEGEQEDIVSNSLDYDNGYHAGWRHAETGSNQRETTVDYTADFNQGYSDGYGAKKNNGEFDKNVRDMSALARDNAQEEAKGLSLEDRVLRLERTVGLASPKQE